MNYLSRTRSIWSVSIIHRVVFDHSVCACVCVNSTSYCEEQTSQCWLVWRFHWLRKWQPFFFFFFWRVKFELSVKWVEEGTRQPLHLKDVGLSGWGLTMKITVKRLVDFGLTCGLNRRTASRLCTGQLLSTGLKMGKYFKQRCSEKRGKTLQLHLKWTWKKLPTDLTPTPNTVFL